MRFAFLFFSTFCYVLLQAQQPDTVFIEEVEIIGVASEKFKNGNKVERVDTNIIKQYQDQNLGTLLQEQTPIYLKSYGTGQLSTVSFRGTGASHTAVLWNGININSLTLGQTDFSTIPVSAVQELKIHYGSASTTYGSGAVGGSILLNANPQRIRGINIRLENAYNSLQNYAGVVGFAWGNQKVQVNTKVYLNDWKNQFEYTNNFKVGFPREEMKQATVMQKGFLQDININFESSKLYGNIWYNDQDKQLQPNMSQFGDISNEQKNTDLRSLLGWKKYLKHASLELKTAYLKDKLNVTLNDGALVFNSDVNSWSQIAEYEWKPISKVLLLAGSNWNHISANVSNFGENKVKENRISNYLFSEYTITPQLKWNVNVRKQWVTDYKAPFIYSTALQFQQKLSKSSYIEIKPAFSTGYRIPSLNDRFWNSANGAGNENVRSEESLNYELGNSLFLKKKQLKASLSTNLYYIQLKDYILWLPTNSATWSPNNVEELNNKGIETQTEVNYNKNKWKAKLQLTYAYTRAKIARSAVRFEEGEQLLYVPKNKATFFAHIQYHKTSLQWTSSYTDTRFATEQHELQAFYKHNISLEQSLKIGKQYILLNVGIQNILNEQYQLYRAYAVPERYYEFKINYLLMTAN